MPWEPQVLRSEPNRALTLNPLILSSAGQLSPPHSRSQLHDTLQFKGLMGSLGRPGLCLRAGQEAGEHGRAEEAHLLG